MMKISTFPSLSIGVYAADSVHTPEPLSPASPTFTRYFPADTTPERQAGHEITSILMKRSRPDLLTCAAPLPSRVRAAPPPDSDDDELFLFSSSSPRCRNSEDIQQRWFAGSPTELEPLVPPHSIFASPLTQKAADTCLPSISSIPTRSAPSARPMNVPKARASQKGKLSDQTGTPTTIVGTPPCRAGNPMVNDTQFLQSKPKETLSEVNVSAIGSELGLFRLSPAAF
eukprot:NODE_3589_length_1323_cov_71.821667_g3138_i0.p1 GENE.NODE_3589_length_1323_cov_71.821667_g3138_i0~~NODE_3589_length_1323_cov_71.821667_g3138_i0.p1  ORF type:complete len:228 (+),score=29.18 NODE_3589_length_1323_cov_71.821667_g3138_i0:68-751(+)